METVKISMQMSMAEAVDRGRGRDAEPLRLLRLTGKTELIRRDVFLLEEWQDS